MYYISYHMDMLIGKKISWRKKFIRNTPSVRLRRTATPFKKGELKTKTPSSHCEER